MSGTVFSTIIIILAVVMAVLAVVLPIGYMRDLIMVTRFFEASLPVLAAGALVKYLCCCK